MDNCKLYRKGGEGGDGELQQGRREGEGAGRERREAGNVVEGSKAKIKVEMEAVQGEEMGKMGDGQGT